jgi:hypothetical protein
MSIDPLASKYPFASPYNFALNNPVYIIDFDGRDIIPYHITGMENLVGTVYKAGEVSAKTEAVLKEIMKTESGLAFLSQFAKKDQTLAGHTFTEDGINSSQDLYINDYSFEDLDYIYETGTEGSFGAKYNDKKGNIMFTLDLMTQGQKEEDIAETYVHETTLHDKVQTYVDAAKKGGKEGFETAYNKEQKENPRGDKEHTALKKHDYSNAGYKKYATQMVELIKVASKYVKGFINGDKEAKAKY